MDTNSRYKKNSPAIVNPKSFKAAFIISISISMVIGFGCSSTNKTNDFVSSNLKFGKELDLQQITSGGNNSDGSWHFSGNKILYTSSNRPTHSSAQIYELDLINKKERRLTFNSGNDASPKYHPQDDVFLYLSTTDAVQETIPLDQLKVSLGIIERTPQSDTVNHPPYEVYLSSLYGSKIRRITNYPGFDGDAQFTADGKKIIYSTFNDTKHVVQILNLQNDVNEAFTPPITDLRWPSIFNKDKSKKVLGVYENPTVSKLLVQSLSPKKEIDLELNENAIYQQPQWHPSEPKIVFSSNRITKNNFDLFVLNLETKCVQQITYSHSLDQDPAFSPDGQKIMFTSNRSGTNQIYFIKYDAAQSCENQLSSI